MDVLNKAFAQISDLFRSMTPGARITTALLLVVVVVSLSYLFNHQMTGSKAYLLGGHSFSANELPGVQAALAAADLNEHELEGNQIRVPRHQQHKYVAALAEGKALPVNWGDYLSRALDSGSPFTVGKEREERLKIARQQELAQVLRDMKDVLNASVQYDSKKKSGFGMQQVSTASVGIQLAGGRQLDAERVKMIRHFVAGAFAGLQPNDVIVADLNGRVHSPVGPDGIGGGDDHRYLAATEAYRKAFEERILNALSYVPGVVVSANVELSTEVLRRTDTTKHDPKSVASMVSEQTVSEKNEAAPRAGAPGLSSQQPNQPAKIVESGKATSSEKESSNRQEHNLVNVDHTQVQDIGMTPKRVTLSISVPSTYFEEVWRQRNPPPAGQPIKAPDAAALVQLEAEEIINIKKHAANLLPKPENMIDPMPLVNVTKFAHKTPAEMPGPSMAQQALAWLSEYWTTLGLVLLAMFSLAMLRSMIRATPPPARSPDQPKMAEIEEKASASAAAQAANVEPPRVRLKRKYNSGESLRDDLVEMVREDPDAAAAILRTWIGTA